MVMMMIIIEFVEYSCVSRSEEYLVKLFLPNNGKLRKIHFTVMIHSFRLVRV